jgi:hypothetical protein
MMRHIGVLALCLLAASAAAAQDAAVSPGMKMIGSDGAVVVGQPFMVVESITTTKTLSDGTVLTHKMQEQKWRDGQGRFRKQTASVTADGRVEFRTAKIFDPTNHTLTTLELEQKRAVVLHMPEGEQAAKLAELLDCGCSMRVRPGVQVRTEALPQKVFAGIYGVGKKTTKVRPPGTIGNDKEVVSTSERYDSPELHILLYSSLDDPREKMVREVTTLQRQQPDIAMFQIPAEFTVRDLPLHQQ